jgi:uncharacterized protein involved in type VI secretion and phage assembly
MEEEGIYYFFEHEDGSHKMIVADTAMEHPTLPGESKLVYEEVEGGTRDENRIWAWRRSRRCAPGSTSCGTTASSCRTSTSRPRRRSSTSVRWARRPTS